MVVGPVLDLVGMKFRGAISEGGKPVVFVFGEPVVELERCWSGEEGEERESSYDGGFTHYCWFGGA